MKIYLKLATLILMVLTFSRCQDVEKKVVQVNVKDFGLFEKEYDSISVELQLDQFKTYDALLKRTEAIACNDSLPKLTLQYNNELKRIYFRNPCRENFACILIKQKNVIEIHNDTINKLDENFYPMDSLTSILKRDLENNGQNPSLCDSPEKLLIYISYDEKGIEKLPNTVLQLIKAYEEVTDRTDLKIWLNERIEVPEMPPPPAEPEETELIEGIE